MQSSNKASVVGILLRRRTLIFFTVVIGLVFYYAPWRLPTSGRSVDEIYGLLHLVASGEPEHEHVLADPAVDPLQTVDWSVYAAGTPQINWSKEAARIDKAHPIVVFSKSYCPYSRKAKQLLQSYDIHPPPLVIEVDLRADGNVLKPLLTRLTGHSTFPNIIVKGESIGGSDDLMSHHVNEELRGIIEEAGARARKDGSQTQ